MAAIVGNGCCQLVLVEVGILSRYCVKNLRQKTNTNTRSCTIWKLKKVALLYIIVIICVHNPIQGANIYRAMPSYEKRKGVVTRESNTMNIMYVPGVIIIHASQILNFVTYITEL